MADFLSSVPGWPRILRLYASAAAEIIRYVSLMMHMRRTALADSEVRGKTIRAATK